MSWEDIKSPQMKFIIPDSLLIHLETWVASAEGREVSGVGTIEMNKEDATITLKRAWLMAAGSSVYTEIPAERMAGIIKEGVRPDLIKVWWHRHPVGNGIPGPHNWSGRDNKTIREEPFGIEPDMVQWLVSIVRTPYGWVGRYDDHIKKQTIHMEVKTRVTREQYEAVGKIIGIDIQKAAPAKPQLKVDRKAPKVGHQKKLFTDHAKKIVNHKTRNYPGGFGRDGFSQRSGIEERLALAGWDRPTYQQVFEDLKYELAEFVAYDNAVTVDEMRIVGLLSQSEYDEVQRRIQIRIDAGDHQYLQLVANWDVMTDG